jgi:hypothetical protein
MCNKVSLVCFQFNSIHHFNGNSTVYWRDPINVKSTSQDKSFNTCPVSMFRHNV